MTFVLTRRFEKSYRKLPQLTQRKFDKQLKLLRADRAHPSLGVRKIQGERNLWEARVDYHYRFVFSQSEDSITLFDIGTHQVYQRV